MNKLCIFPNMQISGKHQHLTLICVLGKRHGLFIDLLTGGCLSNFKLLLD